MKNFLFFIAYLVLFGIACNLLEIPDNEHYIKHFCGWMVVVIAFKFLDEVWKGIGK